ncbi:hypothetical protein EDB85DRAFT_2152059 [Lactarius pseudohatsudake]|nr:hypothetical protein EDB85DRAFT_2152059 [Lactarius pseudohatsudake]
MKEQSRRDYIRELHEIGDEADVVFVLDVHDLTGAAPTGRGVNMQLRDGGKAARVRVQKNEFFVAHDIAANIAEARNSKRISGTLDLKVRGAPKQRKRSIRLLSVAFNQNLPKYFLASLATDPFHSVSAARLTAPRRNDGK